MLRLLTDFFYTWSYVATVSRLVGDNGVGKTTLIKAILGELEHGGYCRNQVHS